MLKPVRYATGHEGMGEWVAWKRELNLGNFGVDRMQDQTTSTVPNREMKRKTLMSIREASRKAFSNPNTWGSRISSRRTETQTTQRRHKVKEKTDFRK